MVECDAHCFLTIFILNQFYCNYLHTSENVKGKLLSHVQLFATPWTVVCQAPLSMEFSR